MATVIAQAPMPRSRSGSLFSLLRVNRSMEKAKTLPSKSSSSKMENSSLVLTRRKSPESNFFEAAMARLDAEFASVRGDLSSMRREGQSLEQRVAEVCSSVTEMEQMQEPALDSIAEDDCESIEEEVEETEQEEIMTFSKFTSTVSLPTSKRDSGFCTDPAFEMIDPDKYCQLNNTVCKSSIAKKFRSTTAIDFIKNNLNEDNGVRTRRFKSCDRLSCCSDSALSTFAVRRRVF